MTQNDGAEATREEEVLDLSDEEQAMLHFSRYSEARAALPWEQRTLKERVMHHLDRIFLVFLAVFFLLLMAEGVYKVWYVTNLDKILMFVFDIVKYFFTQEENEELIEL